MPIAAPALTYAFEFDDGKLMFNDPRNVQAVTWETLRQHVGLPALAEMIGAAKLLSVVNWTNMDSVRGCLEGLAAEVLPRLRGSRRGSSSISQTLREEASQTFAAYSIP